jgi:hypothetical protein
MFIAGLGAIFFGFTIGWIVYQLLRQRPGTGTHGLSDLIAIVGAIGGAAVLALKDEVLFGWYSIGLVIGFFAYLAVGMIPRRQQQEPPWQEEQINPPLTYHQESEPPTD